MYKPAHDERGRFAATGRAATKGVIAANTGKVRASKKRQAVKQAGAVVAKVDSELQKRRMEVLAQLSIEQRGRLINVMRGRMPGTETAEVSPAVHEVTNDTRTHTRRLPSLTEIRAHPSYEPRVKPGELGRIKVHVDAEGFHVAGVTPHKDSFRAEQEPEHQYQVKDGRKTLTLNNHTTIHYFEGEVIHGVPQVHEDITKVSHQELVRSLVAGLYQTRNGSSPVWDTARHDNEQDIKHVGRIRGKPTYGVMQIHHVGQWAQDPAAHIEADFKAGKITKQQYVDRFKATLEPANGASGYQIKVKPKGERDLVILAGGVHQAGTPLYLANHAMFLHPDTGLMVKIGIPKTGESGREWFNGFSKRYWKEYAKNQVSYISAELNDRIRTGKLHPDEAAEHLNVAKESLTKFGLQW